MISLTKYEQIADIIRERIKKNEYPVHSQLPKQSLLAEEFSASRETIKKAIDLLTMEGLVYAQRGSGTVVLNRPFSQKEASPATEYYGLTALMEKEERSVDSDIILFDVTFPNQHIQEKLHITATQAVYHIIRLRRVDNQPYILEHIYMPVHLVPHLTEDILKQSIYDYLKNELDLKFAGAYRMIQADKSDSFDQSYLNCEITDPILEVEQVVYLKNGQLLEYSRSRNRFDVRGYSVLDLQ